MTTKTSPEGSAIKSRGRFLAVSVLALSLGLGAVPALLSAQVATQTQDGQTAIVPPPGQPVQAAPSQEAPPSFADLVERVSPAVVNITTTSTVAAPTNPMFPDGSPFGDLFRDFRGPGGPDDGPGDGMPNGPFGRGGPQRSNALGSGFVVSADGYIVTNNHVIDGADEIEIEFYSGKKLPAKVVGTDKQTDIALLKVDTGSDQLPFVKFGDSDVARVGDWVLALGNPLGQGFSASTGIVSARNRELSGTYDDYLQTDAAINRGNSGGPLFNMNGDVVGVNTAILSPNGGSIGIGFSMASNVVNKVVQQLRDYGETRRGWLGVKIQDVTPDMADALGLPKPEGAMVTDVPQGPAADAGMRSGDVITKFAGGDITSSRDLVRRVADAPVGEAVDVVVMRNGKPEDLKVTLGRRELAEGTSQPGSSVDTTGGSEEDLLGMKVEPMTPEIAAELGVGRDSKGLVVKSVDPEGVAADKGLNAGDIIIEAGQSPVNSVTELHDQITQAKEAGRKSVLLLLRRAGEPRFVALPIE
ncbi:DegQ family serine endoprotease [Paracoccus pacificus]|uniref:DegQ family serine endoprotease n=1 Tax=Paracoccus pacificus TaxID=1463598 RepID=A0ABW4RB43_9RHOB